MNEMQNFRPFSQKSSTNIMVKFSHTQPLPHVVGIIIIVVTKTPLCVFGAIMVVAVVFVAIVVVAVGFVAIVVIAVGFVAIVVVAVDFVAIEIVAVVFFAIVVVAVVLSL